MRGARDAAGRYLDLYPHGPHAGKARATEVSDPSARWRAVSVLLALLAGCCGGVLRPPAARAQAAAVAETAHPRVVLLSITDDDPLAARLAAELEAMGLEVARALINPTVAIEDWCAKR